MRIRAPFPLLLTLTAVALGAAASAQRSPSPAPAADTADLPPLSYVCPSPGEENVVVDAPGKCPKSGEKLVPARLDIVYSCLRGPRDIRDKVFTCAYDKTEAGPVTGSIFWTCKDDPQRYLEPGSCKDGARREKGFEIRPHGDHNPRHGGLSVFMSEDLLHHVEGTLAPGGVFRVYFYDVYTRPMRPAGFSAQVARADSNAKELAAPVALTAAKTADGNAMEVKLPSLPTPSKGAPLYFKLHVQVKPGAKDWVTDYQFDAYSKEPPPPAAATGASAKPPAAASSSATAAKSPSGSSAGQTGAGRAAAPKNAQAKTAPKAPSPPPSPPANVTLPGVPQQDVLPDTAPELVAELAKRAADVDEQLQSGAFGAVWLPALGAKDVALKLEDTQASGLSDEQRARLASAVRQLTLSAWQIDAAGDLGNKDRLMDLYQSFSAAVKEVLSLYGAGH